MFGHVGEIIKKTRRRYWILRHLKKYGMTNSELVQVYCSLIRSVVEFCAVVYGPMLTMEQADRLEHLQSQSLKVIYGFDKSYRQVLELSGLAKLSARREQAIEKFAVKSKEGRFPHWFPLNPSKRQNRTRLKYKEDYARCDRLKKTPIYEMRRVLNRLEL